MFSRRSRYARSVSTRTAPFRGARRIGPSSRSTAVCEEPLVGQEDPLERDLVDVEHAAPDAHPLGDREGRSGLGGVTREVGQAVPLPSLDGDPFGRAGDRVERPREPVPATVVGRDDDETTASDPDDRAEARRPTGRPIEDRAEVLQDRARVGQVVAQPGDPDPQPDVGARPEAGRFPGQPIDGDGIARTQVEQVVDERPPGGRGPARDIPLGLAMSFRDRRGGRIAGPKERAAERSERRRPSATLTGRDVPDRPAGRERTVDRQADRLATARRARPDLAQSQARLAGQLGARPKPGDEVRDSLAHELPLETRVRRRSGHVGDDRLDDLFPGGIDDGQDRPVRRICT